MRKLIVVGILAVCILLPLTAQKSSLYDAVYTGDVALVEQLLKSGVDPNQKQDGDAPIGLAIRENRKEIYNLIIQSPKFRVNDSYIQTSAGTTIVKHKKTAIYEAIFTRDVELVKALLAKGANVNTRASMWEIAGSKTYYMPETHPMQMALGETFTPAALEIATLLEPNVTDFKTKYKANDQYGNMQELISMCIPSAAPEYTPVLIKLIQRGYNINYSVPLPESAYKIAQSQKLPAESITMMKKYGAMRVLDYAVMANNLPLVEWLIGQGVKIDKSGDNGALLFTYTHDISIIKALVKAGVDINVTQPGSEANILQLNISQMDSKSFEELLKMGADPNHKNKFGNTVQECVAPTPFMPKDIKKNIKLVQKYQTQK